MKRCPRCGREFPAEFQFCQDDATRLVPVTNTVPPETAREAVAAKAQNGSSHPNTQGLARRGLLAAVAVVVIGTVTFALSRHNAPPPSSAFSQGASLSQGTSLPAQPSAASPQNDPGDSNDTASPQAGWQSYRNPQLGFACDYPAGWTLRVTASQASAGATRVLFQSPDPRVCMLVDAQPGTTGMTPLQKWQDLDGRFRKSHKAIYAGLGIEACSLAGYNAASWHSTLQHPGGPLLEREDVGSTIDGRDYALLLSAPPAEFARWHSAFRHVTQTFTHLNTQHYKGLFSLWPQASLRARWQVTLLGVNGPCCI